MLYPAELRALIAVGEATAATKGPDTTQPDRPWQALPGLAGLYVKLTLKLLGNTLPDLCPGERFGLVPNLRLALHLRELPYYLE
jgi:hypothetical protein